MILFKYTENDEHHNLNLNLHDSKYIVDEQKLKRLLPYIVNLIESSGQPALSSIKEKIKIVVLKHTQAAFELEGEENASDLLNKIQKICEIHLTEKMIATQHMGYRQPKIHHRIIGF